MNFIIEMEETNKEPKICAMRGRADGEWHESEHEQRIECREDGVTNTITGVSKDNLVAEPNGVINPLKGKTGKSWFFEQQVYDEDGIARTIKSTEGSGNAPKVIVKDSAEPTIIQQVGDRGNGYYSEKDTAFTIPANPMSDRCQMVKEPSIIANTAGFGQCYESKEVSPTVKSSAFQYNNALLEPVEQIPLNTDQDGLATTVTTAHHYSGNIVDPKRGQKEMGVLEKQHNLPFRVRRLTERELFRLMDLSEKDIDKIQAAGISKTQQAKMAGNSICVNVLYHIFRKMFVDTGQESAQLELF